MAKAEQEEGDTGEFARRAEVAAMDKSVGSDKLWYRSFKKIMKPRCSTSVIVWLPRWMAESGQGTPHLLQERKRC